MNLIEKLEKSLKHLQDSEKGQYTVGVSDGYELALCDVKDYSNWISVNGRLPEHNGEYMVYLIVGADNPIKTMAFCGYMAETKQFVLECEGLEVTHWCEVPQPPSEVQSD